ncbi:MAG: fibronectin type III domain-containing protein [Spirochaetota bacterium]
MKPARVAGCLLFLCAAVIFAQEGPPAYVVPATDRAIVVLGDTPPTVHGFQVYRKGRWARSYDLLTAEPITAADDAYEAVRLMGSDFRWISRKLDSMDPQVVWRKLKMDRNLAQAYALLSHGLRLALGRTWIDTEVEPGRRYDYRVVLLDSSGDEIGRYERRIKITDPEQPPPPQEVSAEYSDGLVSIGWDYPAFEGGEDDRTVGFVVLRRRGSGAFEPLSPAPVLRIDGYLNAFDEKVRVGETYTYAVVAQDIIGVISNRAESEPLAIEDTTPPLVPVGLRARDRGDDVLLIWKMSPELDVRYYNVFRSFSVEDEAEIEQLNTEPVSFENPRFVDENAPRGVPVYYRVSAVDSRGNQSRLSGPAPLLAEDTQPPGAVAKLSATVDKEARRVALSWQGPDDADLSGYYVYSGPDAAQLMRITSAPLQPDRRAVYTDSGYAERGLEPGKSLVYAVSAVDASYNESPREVVEVEIPDKVPPEAPSGFAVRPTREGAVRLSWQPVLCFDLAGYRVYRSEGRKFAGVADLPETDARWLDGEAERGKKYLYYITALDSSGNESPPTEAVEIVPTDISPPGPPQELTAELEKRGVRLRWEASPDSDVKLYVIYRSDYPGGKPSRELARIDGRPTYLDRRGKAGLVYALSAVDTSGNEGRRQEVQVE